MTKKSHLLEATIKKMLESYLGEIVSKDMTAGETLNWLSSQLATETNPARREKIAMAIQKGNKKLAGAVNPPVTKEASWKSNIRSLVEELVEDTMLKRNKVIVPMPKNPVVSPGGPAGPKELLGILAGIDDMQSLEDISPEDKMILAQAKELMMGVFKKKSSSSGMRQEETKIDYDEEKRRRKADLTISKARGRESDEPISPVDQDTKADGFAALKKRR